ncbi:MAG: AMP-binding protein [Actinomycetota bacterium]
MAAEADPDRRALTHDETTVTRMELEKRTNRLARAYEQLGVKQNDLVTIALPNSIEFFESAIACWKLGATPQPVSAKLPAAELEAIIELANPPIVVGGPQVDIGERVQIEPGFGPDPSLPDEPLPERIAASWKAPTSGGSTGRPKIILSGTRGVTQLGVGGAFGVPHDAVVLVPGALYHNAPFQFAAIGLFRGSHVIVTTRFDPAQTVELMERHRVTWMWVVPTMMSRVMRLPEGERLARDVSSVKTVWHGAAPCPPWVKEAWINWLGGDAVWELYAGTEGQGLCVISGTEWLEHRGSVGRTVYGKMKVVDENGNELPSGEIGEIYMLPPEGGKTYSYIGAQAKVLDGHGEGGAERWESIGDMGWIDDDGYVYLADRRTDLILAGGANIYPAEVEAALDEHPMVQTCAVIGLPDEDMGQAVHAIVQTRGEVAEQELRDFLSERLVRYKLPRTYEFVDGALRDDAGKVRRSQLREERIANLTARKA